MATQTYMTAKLNLADGTIVYPQISLDNIVRSISDPTLVTVAELSGGKVPIAQLPTTLTVTDSNTTVPTAGAVYGALNTKQATLVEGDNIIHIINGSTIMADITNLDVAGIDQTATNGVHLVLDGNTVSAAAELAGTTAGVAGTVMGATNGVTLDGGVVTGVFGDGVEVVGNTAKVDIATVAETLNGTAGSNMVDADGLRGAMSLGQAVDVSCAPQAANDFNKVSFDGGSTWLDMNTTKLQDGTIDSSKFLGDFIIKTADSRPTTATATFGFTVGGLFPKRANGLKYLVMMDVKNTSTANLSTASMYTSSAGTLVDGVPRDFSGTVPQAAYTRIAIIMEGTGNNAIAYLVARISQVGTIQLDIKNWRQYEVTNLTDEAIQYLASAETNPDPDELFRSQDFFDVSAGYMIKSDMVCPWTYLIGMPANSPAMTVAAGLAYQLQLTDGAEHEITVDTFPTNAYGQDSHIQLLLSNNSTAVFKSPLNLIDALTPNAAHNITVKFRAGQANVYVDDTDAGYVVTVTAGTESGSLYYGLMGSDQYIVFRAADTDNIPIHVDTMTLTTDHNVIGNGPDKTELVSDGRITTPYSLDVTGVRFTGGDAFTDWLIHGSNSNLIQGKRISISDCTIQNYTLPSGSGIYGLIYGFLMLNNVSNCYVTGCTFGNQSGVVHHTFLTTQGCSVTGCTFQNNYGAGVRPERSVGLISNCLFDNNHSAVIGIQNDYNVGYSNYLEITGCTFTTAADAVLSGRNTNVKFSGKNIFNSTFTGQYFYGGGTFCFASDSVLDLTGNTNAVISKNGSAATPDSMYIFVGGRDATTGALTGGTATVLYSSALDGELDGNGQPFTKSRTISGGGTGYIMRNNGSIGVPVTVADGTAAGTLYEKLTDTSIKDITFAPVIDGSTIDALNYGGSDTGLFQDHAYNINGAGRTNTFLKYRFGNSDQNAPFAVTISCLNLVVAQPFGSFWNLTIFDNCEIHTSMQLAGHITIQNCYCHNITAVNSLWRQTLGPSTADRGTIITGSTFAHVRVTNDTYESPNDGLYVSWPLFENTTFTDMNNIAMYRGTASISGCLFDNTGVAKAKFITGSVNETWTGSAVITGSTFTNYDILTKSGSTVTFSGTNTLNSAVLGEGTVVFTDGATVTSEIPSGQTIGTGVISVQSSSTGGATIQNITLSNIASPANSSAIGHVGAAGKSLSFVNCRVTGNTAASGGSTRLIVNSGSSPLSNMYLTNTVVTNNPSYTMVYAYSGSIILSGSTISGVTTLVYKGNLVFKGQNSIGGVGYGDASAASNGTMVLVSGSTTTFQGASVSFAASGNNIIVGTYNEATGAITESGTAVVILAGTTVTVSGSGKVLDSTGLHS